MTSALRPEEGAFFDLSVRCKLRISGRDRLRYLNGQITNDLRKASEDVAIHACVLNAKGKIDADVFIAAEPDSFVIDADAEVREALAARLERYIIADDVQVEDVTEQHALFHAIGANVPSLGDGVRSVKAERYGTAGTDIWVPAAARSSTREQLAAMLPLCDKGCAETFRIERGIPRWGFELSNEIIPIEANLEAATVDYAKGCYIGQEVISRMKMSGQTNKRLCGLLPEQSLTPGTRLRADDKEVGWVTSATWSERLGKWIALGFVKRGFQEPGTELRADDSIPVRVAPLPLV
ncbi:MAG TPA: glycine cleavage T C-terminal barrel domain-containing protein [Chthoniobacterales bacterium]|nr:glycine cleavage T C-terminal barrel domain-containing protein [Chthoniobacterales bacterium]